MQGIIEDRIYGIKSRTNKQADRVTKFALNATSQIFLGFNYLSASVNALAGMTNIVLQSSGGIYFNKKDVRKGVAEYFADIVNIKQDAVNGTAPNNSGILGDLKNNVQTSRTNTLLEGLNIHQGNQPINRKFSSDNAVKEYLNSDLGSFMHNAGEHMIVSSIMYAMLENIKITDELGRFVTLTGLTEDVTKALTLGDVLKTSNGEMTINAPTHAGSLRMTEYNLPLNKESLKVVSRKIADIKASSQGQVAENKRPLAKMYWYSRLMLSMRGWLPETYRQRLQGITTVGISRKNLKEGDVFYSRAKGKFQEGTYTTFIRFTADMVRELKANKQRLGQIRAIYGDTINEYSRDEVAQLRRASFEIASIFLLTALGRFFKNIKNDLPKDGAIKPLAYFFFFLNMRLRNELLGYVNPLEQWRNVKSISASMDIIDSVGKFAEQLLDPLELYKTGKQKGKSKLFSKFGHIFPYINQYNRSVQDAYGYLIGDKSKSK